MEIENKIKNIMNDNFNSNHIQIDENTKLFSGGLNLTSINMLRLVLKLTQIIFPKNISWILKV